ncbi:hypothetical protein OG21DRAFT_934089 [Imleria badia]|nr:hypothetical protein OG21DRAFT_934089 [Imleria badia]
MPTPSSKDRYPGQKSCVLPFVSLTWFHRWGVRLPRVMVVWLTCLRVGELISRKDKCFCEFRPGSGFEIGKFSEDVYRNERSSSAFSRIAQGPSASERRYFHITRVLDLVANEVATGFATHEAVRASMFEVISPCASSFAKLRLHVGSVTRVLRRRRILCRVTPEGSIID